MENLGDKIRERREEKQMTIDELSEKTYLSVAILKDIEAGKFDRYEGEETYVKMYLKKISDVLDLDREELTQSYVALTEEIKLAQIQENEAEKEHLKKDLVKNNRGFQFGAPHLARNKSVYEDKSHIKIIRVVIIVVLVALVIGVLWWGISSTKSKVDNPEFDPQQSTKIDGDVTDDTTDDTQTKDDQSKTDESTDNTTKNTSLDIERTDKLNFDFTLNDDSQEFTFKIVFGNESWATMKVNGSTYDEFESRTYSKDEEVELTFKVDEFENLDLKNGYSMGHKYYINDVELPLTDEDNSESITHLIVNLKKN